MGSYASSPSPSAPSLPEHSRNDGPYGSFHASYSYPGQLPVDQGQWVPAAGPKILLWAADDVSTGGRDQCLPNGVDRARSGFIDENELRQALSSGYQRFDVRTIRLLMFLFRNPSDTHGVEIRSGQKLRDGDALYSLGYAIPPSVLQVLISRYGDGSGRQVELNFDSFVECGMIMKGLTEKFKEKDPQYTGSATVGYDPFLSMIIPFLVSYNRWIAQQSLVHV